VATILLTGGTGYIGSHTCVELINAGYETILYDNLCNSSPVVVDRIEKISGKRPVFIEGDIRDAQALCRLFEAHAIDAVIHFAGLKAVGESVEKPLDYYINNVCGSATLFDAMRMHGVRQVVFSSSATVYDPNAEMPLKETSPVGPVNPYGRTKLMIEQIILDMARADSRWRVICLRYFNPVGAHQSGMLGEDPRDVPNNLMPYVAQVAVGRLPVLKIFGTDYPTADGTGVRDYIHVCDLASGHTAALKGLLANAPVLPPIVNLGRGKGHSVREVVDTFRAVSSRSIPIEVVARRAGDVATSYADVALARSRLHWAATQDLRAMCEDAWRWQSANPTGYSR
jgi:UDP-glucose 4-epimerase